MPKIPPTRSLTMKHPSEDFVQWTLTNHHQKTKVYQIPRQTPTIPITTIDVAKRFITLLNNQNNKEAKIKQIVKDIEHLHNSLSFNSKKFTEYVTQHASSTVRLMQVYYDVNAELTVVGIPLDLLLEYIPDLDEPLLELLSYNEDIAKVYTEELDDESMNDLFTKDGSEFLNWSKSMQREKVKRLEYILRFNGSMMRKDQCISQLLRLKNTLTVDDLSTHYYKQISHTKESILSPNKVSIKQQDALIIKAPVLKLLSTWFFEFEPARSKLKISEFALKIYQHSETKQNVPDISLLLYVYNTACKQLAADGRGVTYIPEIIQTLNHAVVKSLEQDGAGGLAIILSFAQFTFEQMHELVGLTYVGWFDNSFIQSKSSLLNKRQGVVFMNILQQLIPYELASVLQVQGKALHHCSSLPNTTAYAQAVKRRLLELGVDASFKNFPPSLKKPLQSVIVQPEDDISALITQFKNKDGGVIPSSLASAFLFRKQWYLSILLPSLLGWDGTSPEMNKSRDELVDALRKDKKKMMPDHLYSDFIAKKKKKNEK